MPQDPNQEFDRYCELHVNISRQIAAKLRRQQNEQRSKSMYARAASAHYKKLNKDMSITAAALTNEYLKSYKVIGERAPARAIPIPTRSLSAGAQQVKQTNSSDINDDVGESLPEAAKVLRDTSSVQSRLADFLSHGMNVTASGLPNLQQQQQQQQQQLSVEQQAIKHHQEWQKRNFDEGVSRYNSVQQYKLKQLTNIYASSTNCVPFSRKNDQPICSIDADWVLAEKPARRAQSSGVFTPKLPQSRPRTPKRAKIVINKLRPWIQEEHDFAGTPPVTGRAKRQGRSQSCGAITSFAPVEQYRDILAANQLEKAAQELKLIPSHKNFRRVKELHSVENDDFSASKDPEKTPDILDDELFSVGGLSRNFKSAIGRQLFADSPVRNVDIDKSEVNDEFKNILILPQEQPQAEQNQVQNDINDPQNTEGNKTDMERPEIDINGAQSPQITQNEIPIENQQELPGDGGFLPDLVFPGDSAPVSSSYKDIEQNTNKNKDNFRPNLPRTSSINFQLPPQIAEERINKLDNDFQESKFQNAYDNLLKFCPDGFNSVLTSAAIKARLLGRARAIEHQGLVDVLQGIKTHEDVAAAAAAKAEAQRRAEAARTPDELREIDDQVRTVKKTLLPEEKYPALAVCSRYANHDTKAYKAGLIAELLGRRENVLSSLVRTGKMTDAEARKKEFRPHRPVGSVPVDIATGGRSEGEDIIETSDQNHLEPNQINANPHISATEHENESDWPDYEDLIATKARSATGVRRKTIGLDQVLENMLNGFQRALSNQQRLQSLGFQGGAFPVANGGAKDRFGRRAIGNTWLPQLELEKDALNVPEVPGNESNGEIK